MVKFNKKEAKTLKKLEEGRIFTLGYDAVYNKACISEECDQYFGIALTKKDCLRLSSVFLKLAQEIIKNEPKSGELKVVEKEVEKVKIQGLAVHNTWLAKNYGVNEAGELVYTGIIGSYTTREELIKAIEFNEYSKSNEYEYVKFEDGLTHYAVIQDVFVKEKF